MRPWFVASLAMAAAACAGPRVVDSPVVVDSLPTLRITAETDAAVPNLGLVEQLRIEGTSESTGWGYITGVAVSDRGEICVVDQQAGEVQVFHHSGTLKQRIGRPGSGPGELGRPTWIAIGGDTLFILDSRGLNQFLADGTFLRRVPIRGGGSGARPRSAASPRTLAYGSIGLVTSLGTLGPSAPQDTVLVVRLEGRTGEVGPPVANVSGAPIYWVTKGFGGYAWGTQRQTFAVSQDSHLFMSNAGGIDVDVLSLKSGERSRIRWDIPRLRVSRADIRAVMQEIERHDLPWPAYVPMDRQSYFNALRKLPRAKYRQIVGRLIAATSGELLVERLDLSPMLPAPGLRLPSVWDILTRAGTVLGRVEFPAGYTPMVMAGSTVTGVAMDSLDVPSIVRYGLQIQRKGQRSGAEERIPKQQI